jgi:hypothetical protein
VLHGVPLQTRFNAANEILTLIEKKAKKNPLGIAACARAGEEGERGADEFPHTHSAKPSKVLWERKQWKQGECCWYILQQGCSWVEQAVSRMVRTANVKTE